MAVSKRKRSIDPSPQTPKRPERRSAAAAPIAKTRRKPASDSDDDDDFISDSSSSGGNNSNKGKKEKRGKDKTGTSTSTSKGDRGGNDNNDSDSDSDNVVITAGDFHPPKIKVPEPKNSPFPDALAPSSMIFMATLKENNDRVFMKLHQDRWNATKKDFMDFVDLLAGELHGLDETVLVQPAKDAIYRQHRDLRFTKDRIPYKLSLRASFSRQGKKSPLPGYHISIEPGNETVIAVGIFQPEPVLKQRMRAGIIRQGDLLREALSTDAVKEVFGGKVGTALLSDMDKLKVAPKGFDKDHPEIELLRYNSMFVTKKLDDIDMVSEGCLDKILDVFDALLPFVTVLNAWIA